MLEESCLIIAGEKSGEEHAMSFLPDLLQRCPNLKLFGVGGDEMKALGVELNYHLKDFSSWGVSEVIGKIPFYINAHKALLKEVEKRKARYAILIDFQDFNLRLAKQLKKRGVEVLYYVAPQAWAWKAHRAQTLAKTVNTLFTIIPFEKEWFTKRGVDQCRSVPHPLWFHYHKQVGERSLDLESKPYSKLVKKPRILCLPGSRNAEVRSLLPRFCEALKEYGDCEAGIVVSPNVNASLYKPYFSSFSKIWNHGNIADALEWADMSLAASGTVTLTCALFEVPTVVCYSSSFLNEFIFYTFLSYDGPISLANIVHEENIFPELVQEGATSFNMVNALRKWSQNQECYEEAKRKLSTTVSKISGEVENVGTYMGDIILKGQKGGEA